MLVSRVRADEHADRYGRHAGAGDGAQLASLSEYASPGMAIQEALALERLGVVRRDTPLAELTGYPNVRSLQRARGGEVAAAIPELLDAGPAEPPMRPAWDECTTALLELEETLAERS